MNYQKIYDSLIKKSVGRKKYQGVYFEEHHIKPRCLGGSNKKENIALLTAEEHWVAHLLLVKIYPENRSLVNACQAMSMIGGKTKRTTNKMFGWIRREYSKYSSERQTGKSKSEETKKKISESLKGRLPESQRHGNIAKRPEVAKKISESLKKAHTEGKFDKLYANKERNEKIRQSKLGKPNKFLHERNPNNIRVCCLSCKKETTYPVFRKSHIHH